MTVPTTENDTPAHFDVFTDPKLAAMMIGYREKLGCKILMLYAQPRADATYVQKFDQQNGPTGDRLPVPIAKTWVLVSTSPKG